MAEEKKPFDQADYIKQFNRDTYRKLTVYLHKRNDQDIIEYLDTVPSKTACVKDAVRAKMKAGNYEDQSE